MLFLNKYFLDHIVIFYTFFVFARYRWEASVNLFKMQTPIKIVKFTPIHLEIIILDNFK